MSVMREGVTFTPGQEDIAARVERAESVLYSWACGNHTAAEVRKILRVHGIHLRDRLNPHGLPIADADVDGFGFITLRY